MCIAKLRYSKNVLNKPSGKPHAPGTDHCNFQTHSDDISYGILNVKTITSSYFTILRRETLSVNGL